MAASPVGVEQTLGETTCTVVGDGGTPAVVLLHGYCMQAADFVPFASSLGLAATFYFPHGICVCPNGKRAWWLRDAASAASSLARNQAPLDLYDRYPRGRLAARAHLRALLIALHAKGPVAVVGFSQGGMLAVDTLLLADEVPPLASLALLSSSRIAWDEWQPRLARLAQLPVMISHGHHDTHVSFAAGQALRDAAAAGGAQVTWLPYDGGHQVPLVVWRALRKFLQATVVAGSPKTL